VVGEDAALNSTVRIRVHGTVHGALIFSSLCKPQTLMSRARSVQNPWRISSQSHLPARTPLSHKETIPFSSHDLHISGLDENSESGTSYPEADTSLKDMIKHHASGPPPTWQQVQSSTMEPGCAPPRDTTTKFNGY
jgi:hypothetical protein